MMVTLFKADITGRLRFCIVHDLQRSLLGGFALTVANSIGEKAGKDVMHVFESERERTFWLNRLIARKQKTGFRELYRYGIAESRPGLSRTVRRVG